MVKPASMPTLELAVQFVGTSSVGILAGFTIYALRGGALLASWFSTMPVWSTLDPLPVISTKERTVAKRGDKSGEGEEAPDLSDSLFANE